VNDFPDDFRKNYLEKTLATRFFVTRTSLPQLHTLHTVHGAGNFPPYSLSESRRQMGPQNPENMFMPLHQLSVCGGCVGCAGYNTRVLDAKPVRE